MQDHLRFTNRVTRSRKPAGVIAMLALTAAIAAAGSAEAATIYLHAPDYPGPYSAFNSQNGGALDNRAYDNFALAGADTILSITWMGHYRPEAGTTEMPPTATDFLVQFWSDNAGVPGVLLASHLYDVADTNETRIGGAVFAGDDVGVYTYALDIVPFVAAGGTTYWLMIQAQTGTSTDPRWGWMSGGGAGTTYQTISGVGTMHTQFNNRAFSLSNELVAVPEPATLLLLGAGLAAAAVRLRRRQSVR